MMSSPSVFRQSLLFICGWIVIHGVYVRDCLAQGTPPSVRLTLIEGDAVEGRLIAADTQTVKLEASGETKEWESQKVLRLDLSPKSVGGAAPMELGLLDGTVLKGTKLAGKEQLWQFGDSAGSLQEFGPGVVRWLLVRKLTPELATAWNDALKEPVGNDSLILIRPGNVIDRVGGIINEVKDGKVVFDLDGQMVEVPFEKLLGLIWFRKPQDRVKPKIEIHFTDGSLILADTLALSNESLTYRGISGSDVAVPISRISLLSYGSANVKWLAELPTLAAVSDRRIEWKGGGESVGKMMVPRFVSGPDQSRGEQPLGESEGKSEDFDLVFLSPGSFTFRVPEGFSRFRTRIERSGTGTTRSDLTIEVLQDDQSIFRHELRAEDDRLDLDLPLLGGKKVSLMVASKNRLQIGSQVTWKQPRLTR